MILGIIQARMQSVRLPGKVLLPLEGKPVLWHIFFRLAKSKLIDDICISTSTNPIDDKIEKFAHKYGIKIFRGSKENLVKRHLDAAKKFDADVIVRITGDCPLVDPQIVDEVIEVYLKDKKLDFVSNTKTKTYPIGLDVEVFPVKTLEKIFSISEDPIFYEYFISNYIFENPSIFKSKGISLNNPNMLRWTLDYPEDYMLFKKIFGELYLDDKIFHMDDVLNFLEEHIEISKINSMHYNEFSHLKYQREMSKKK
ncbi:Spore coat polysaccharide biosynthesis protein SpsF [Marine Group I thaumarchaeote SCGC AAA799-D07]|nr:Spore coat polysaccharide biosynthesis protein SpsF [Marine Group I thaumarchaeote SCGC AAA799-D07]